MHILSYNIKSILFVVWFEVKSVTIIFYRSFFLKIWDDLFFVKIDLELKSVVPKN